MKKVLTTLLVAVSLFTYSQERVYFILDSMNRPLVKYKNVHDTKRKMDSIYNKNNKYNILKINSYIENVPVSESQEFMCTYRRRIKFTIKETI